MTPHPAEITCENAFKYRASTVNRALQAPLSGAPIEAAQLAKLVWEISDPATHEAIREVIYARTLFQLQCELVKLQRWVHAKKLKIVVIFEGRDAAGKGGMIRRITHRLDPRLCRERSLWAFSHWLPHRERRNPPLCRLDDEPAFMVRQSLGEEAGAGVERIQMRGRRLG